MTNRELLETIVIKLESIDQRLGRVEQLASPNRKADLPKPTNDTAVFSFGCKIFVTASCF